MITWDANWTADTVFAGSVVVGTNRTALSGSISLVGKSLMQVAVKVAAQDGGEFDQANVWLGFVNNDGVVPAEPIPVPGDQEVNFPLVRLTDLDNLTAGPVNSLLVSARLGAVLSLAILNRSGVAIIPTVTFKQAVSS